MASRKTGQPKEPELWRGTCSRHLFMADYLADPRKAYGFCGLGALQRPQVLRHNSSNYGGVLFTDPRKRGENASKDAQLAGVCVLTIMAEYFARANDGVSAKRSSCTAQVGKMLRARRLVPHGAVVLGNLRLDHHLRLKFVGNNEVRRLIKPGSLSARFVFRIVMIDGTGQVICNRRQVSS